MKTESFQGSISGVDNHEKGICVMTPGSQLQRLKDQGRTIIACFPPYPPLPLFHSMGLVPVVGWGLRDHIAQTGAGDRHLPPYTCSVARHLTEFILTDARDVIDGIFMYNACDTLRSLPEILMDELSAAGRDMPIFRMHLPMSHRDHTDASAYLENEIHELVGDISGAYGVVFSPGRFQASVVLYQRMRHLAVEASNRVAAGRISFADFTDVMLKGAFMPVEDHIAALAALIGSAGREPADETTGVMISGILAPPAAVIKAIESAGLTIVVDDVAPLYRSYGLMPGPQSDPGDYFRRHYDDHYPCPTLLHTADQRAAALVERVAQNNARAVIFLGEKFCEYEYFEIPYLAAKLSDKGISTLQIELSIEDGPHTAAHDARIAAFAEMIRQHPDK